MPITIVKENKKYRIRGRGTCISLGHIIGEHFNKYELKNDILSKKLKIDKLDDEDILEYISSESWEMLHVNREDLVNWIEFKNDQLQDDLIGIIRDDVTSLRKTVTDLGSQIEVLCRHISKQNKALLLPQIVKLKDVAEILPDYNIGSLRNMLARNKHENTEKGVYESRLEIGPFRLKFWKPLTGKTWIADKTEYDPQKSITVSGRFQQEIRDRLKHGKKILIDDLVKFFFI